MIIPTSFIELFVLFLSFLLFKSFLVTMWTRCVPISMASIFKTSDKPAVVSSDWSSCTDDGLLYIRAAATFSDFEHLCLSILFQVSL